MLLTSLLIPTYMQMLKSLSGWLGKAQVQLPEIEVQALLSARLAPDMFPLSTQIRFACVQAQEGVYRLQGEPFPTSLQDLLNEGRNGAGQPGTIADAQKRIEQTIALLKGLTADALDVHSDAEIAHVLPNGMIFDLTAEQFARDWNLPQFYFHLMTAYAILRSEKVELGKADYVQHMFPYLRPGTAPPG